jgi:hypothetical protein
MRNAFRLSVLVIALVTIVSVAGCSSGSKEVAPAKDRALSIMQMVPTNVSSFSFIDIYALRTDKNLSSAFEYFQEYYLGNDSIVEKINGMVAADELYLFEGDFALDQVMEFMGITINGSYNYGGLNVRTGSYNSSGAMINGSAIIGYDKDVRSCIDVVNGNASLLYGNADIKAIVSRLPVGFELYISIVGNESVSENMSGLLLAGASVTMSGGDYIETEIYQFNTSDAAQQYVATAGSESNDDTTRTERTQDGVYVTAVTMPLTYTPTPAPTVLPTETSTPTPTSTPTS